MALGYTVFTGALKTLEPHTQRRIDPGARAEKTDLIKVIMTTLLSCWTLYTGKQTPGGVPGGAGRDTPGTPTGAHGTVFKADEVIT